MSTSNAGIDTWLKWFSDEYGDTNTGGAVNEKDDMAFARNKILAGAVDALERIATILEKEFERHNSM